ncbi:biogenesis of lysosome-related organelles complex 1 subunit 5 [Xenentodon cancila]
MDKVVKADTIKQTSNPLTDVGDVQSRLLDHRPVINAEVRFFVREFEEKRGYRENRLLENLNKMVQETNEQMLPMNVEDVNQRLSDVVKRLEAANHMAERVQQREVEAQQGTQLQANMEKLREDWAEFLKEQQRLKEEVDEEHAKAVGELSARFNEKKKKDLAQYSLI